MLLLLLIPKTILRKLILRRTGVIFGRFFSLNDHELLAKHSSILQKDLGKAGKLPLPF